MRRGKLMAKQHGGWRTDSSLKRFAKETRLQAELHKFHPSIIVYGCLVPFNPKLLFRHPKHAPPPPFIGRPPKTPGHDPPAA
jgi:hypothetical protein